MLVVSDIGSKRTRRCVLQTFSERSSERTVRCAFFGRKRPVAQCQSSKVPHNSRVAFGHASPFAQQAFEVLPVVPHPLGPSGRDHFLHEACVELAKEIELGLEVEKERAASGVCPGGDVVHRGFLEAILGKEGDRSFVELFPRPDAAKVSFVRLFAHNKSNSWYRFRSTKGGQFSVLFDANLVFGKPEAKCLSKNL